MRKIMTVILLFLRVSLAHAQGDPHSICMMDIAIEGPVDSLRQQLKDSGLTEWGQSDDGEDYYFRGNFYGIRAKIIVTAPVSTGLVSSAYVTIGPYRTQAMLERNLQYFRNKLEKVHGALVKRGEAWVFMDDCGSVRLSIADNDNGTHDIRVLYLVTAAYYKDALSMGLRGSVQEVVTENAVAEEQFMHFSQNGQLDNADLTNRQYNRHGYLIQAQMTEKEGYSTVVYAYNSGGRLSRRTLTNEAAGIRYDNEYVYNAQGDILSQSQKVFDKSGQCVLAINTHNNYLTRDDEGNWTTNSMTLSYWEKDSPSQQTTVLQKRTLTYWNE